MIRSYDFIFEAQRDKKLMSEIVDCIESKADQEICTEIHRLIFCGKEQIVMVEPVSDIVQFSCKIIPVKIEYQKLLKLLDNKWDEI